ncbi:zinc-binding dehydrogenase [Mycolicibacterium komossense]|uniref:zinc-binding dehydrogenase n=1 Tax=Mycolicibacterium komossense TaxID=1779 RepID=UPI00338E19FF
MDAVTEGYGAHSVFECSGADDVLDTAIPLLRRGGRLVQVAFRRSPRVEVDYERVTNFELELVGSRGKRPSSYRTALRLMQDGRVDVTQVQPRVLPIEKWQQGLDLVAKGRKVVFELAR